MGKCARRLSSGPEPDCIPPTVCDASAYDKPAHSINNANAMMGHCGKKAHTAQNNDSVTTDEKISTDDAPYSNRRFG